MFKIEVTIYPWGGEPRGAQDHVVELACANDGTGNYNFGSYDVWVMEHGETPREAARSGRKPIAHISDYPRSDTQGHLASLAALILEEYDLASACT